MCGIIGIVNKKSHRVEQDIKKQYENQKTRGREGFGYCAVENGRVHLKHSTTEEGIFKKLSKEKSPFIMFHHRYPTSTINVDECCHPIKVSHEELDYDYFVQHNGVIRNDTELKKEHDKLGYIYSTELEREEETHYVAKKNGGKYVTKTKLANQFNDSESFAIELARCIDGMSRKINCVGTIAFHCIKTTKDGKFVGFYYGHNTGNPLCVSEDKHTVMIKSVGGSPLPTDIMYCVTENNGVWGCIERKIKIGYSSEWEKSQDTGYNSNTSTYVPAIYQEEYEDHRVGFQLPNIDQEIKDIQDYQKMEDDICDKYLSAKREVAVIEDTIGIGEEMLNDKTVSASSRVSILKEINQAKKERDDLLEQMSRLEEDYYFKLGNNTDFQDIIEQYEEEYKVAIAF